MMTPTLPHLFTYYLLFSMCFLLNSEVPEFYHDSHFPGCTIFSPLCFSCNLTQYREQLFLPLCLFAFFVVLNWLLILSSQILKTSVRDQLLHHRHAISSSAVTCNTYYCNTILFGDYGCWANYCCYSWTIFSRMNSKRENLQSLRGLLCTFQVQTNRL